MKISTFAYMTRNWEDRRARVHTKNGKSFEGTLLIPSEADQPVVVLSNLGTAQSDAVIDIEAIEVVETGGGLDE
jgi:hypothetical protein